LSSGEGFWYAACPGTGDCVTNKADGKYAQTTFSRIVQGPSEAPAEQAAEEWLVQ
jgi:hypothetical protein